ncbi:unnamed protein product [Rotaria magnacalcarata]|uniref:Uncharacterized protein n=1 Tax=Rotaria magnacalcarata TaxID=392030 RepID=A0A815WVS9_9BILA|nr:unnamed protein product [Rotaria magnacalcarata]CAF1604594.1 unnamed protein product [Rotaria magnacalcarata]CAF1955697.1 unnamed protein product [Rotaria magnacalcarata]CAF2098751.1 unnamed protein product [Rotaria magnacalcarata]CAF2215022.1 unnamed protein product [Rotaria magnacalcarata]
MHSVVRRSPSITSATVADPSKVTVRIESASTSDLNVQDVVTTPSSDNDDDDDELQQQKQQNNNDRFNYRISSAVSRRHAPSLGTNNNSSFQQKRPSRLPTDERSLVRLSQSRPITAVSLPAKPSAYDNEWDLDSARTLVSSAQRRNPSCPLISPTNIRAKSSSQAIFTHHQVPTVFTTTFECLGQDLRPQPRRDMPRRAQSLAKSATIDGNSSSANSSIVFLTNEILLGSIRALQNERQLCKLSIDYLIDATNIRPDELARKANIGVRLQCHCGHTHSRCTLTLEFDQPFIPATSSSSSATTTSTTIDYNNLNNNKIRELNCIQLGQLFSAVNHFISKAQQESKRILIYGFELTPTCPLAVTAIQYLMSNDEQLTLVEATHRINRLFPVTQLQHPRYPIMEKRFQDYLKQLDRKQFPKIFNANCIISDCSSSGNENHQSSRDLSPNSSETTTPNSTPVTSWTTIPISIVNNNDANSPQHISAARSAWDD